MQIETKRRLLFFIGCIGSRSLLTYLSSIPSQYTMLLAIIAAIISMSFLFIYIFDLRKTGLEVFGNRIWWNNLRPVHALLWGIFAYMLANKSVHAWKVLALDTFIGFLSFFILRS